VRYDQILLLAAVILGAGIFLLGDGVANLGASFILGVWDWTIRKLRPRAKRVQTLAREARSPDVYQKIGQYNLAAMVIVGMFRFPLPVLGAVLVAVFMRDLMLAGMIILVGAVVSATLFTRLQRGFYNRLTDELEMLILQFVSRYPLRHSVATALSESARSLPDGMLKAAALNTATRLQLGETENAFRDLVRVPHPIARRFAGVLMRAGLAAPDVFLDLLSQLRKDTESRRELHQRVRRDLTLESATITILQLALIITLIAVGILPAWRDYYVASMANRLFYLTMIGMGIIGTVIGEYEIRYLEEAS
jgi:hypothetical protein